MSTNPLTPDASESELPPWLPPEVEMVDRSTVDGHLPDHIQPTTDDNHDGVCMACGRRITVGPSGTEYGHARRTNRSPQLREKLGDCKHRPRSVDPAKDTTPRGGDA